MLLKAHLIAQLRYVFAGSRIAHYINVLIRDKIGSFLNKTDCEAFLKNWITRYITPAEEASDDVKAQFPLRYAPSRCPMFRAGPDTTSAVLYVTPHFQLEDLAEPIRLSAELPKPVRSDRTYS